MDDVSQRLQSFGYTPTDADSWMLSFCISKVESHIKNNCNVAEVPEGLRSVAVDMACGEFLFGKKQSGQAVGIDFEAVVKSIAEGDTTITFDSKNSAEAKYDALITYLMHREMDFSAYRCIKW
ncbi:hypothetical protein [Sporomusa acidovorans]|uniref:Uncharacterized protein n=1 Tax=Sporomusa acidovorans (strain ATCC 49682 / DSM 3132 / Mol) TaxID=1123286 RepID=A0ABZ3J7C0_SPOA4|nr:hypothetical protein [Sporomusa acidovorans]OZC23808.1 hypothetical protein SPACI_04330 [Sporomusa acidovorans DSM 3132]SDF61816.1 hypothetical protein SAMN04488499_106313 [Sporomusa acidovorans]